MKNIAIIGAGISGLYLANLFKNNEDYKVTIYEKKNSIEINEGYGIQLSVNSVKLLNHIGFNSLTEEEKFNPKKIDFYEIKNSKKICDLEISKFNSENCKYTSLKRSKLLQFLIDGLGDEIIKYNYSINHIEYEKDTTNLTFDNGEKKTCDYLIISDGVFSKGKSLISENKSNAIYNNFIAVRGSISKENLQSISDENVSLFLGSDFHYVVYPLNKDKNFNFIGILKHKLTSNEQKNYKLFDENFFIEKIKNKLSQKISPLIYEKIQNIKFFPIFVSKNFFKPVKNTFLVGDAFFAFSPSFAQGASQSIEGAQELYESILNNDNFFNKRLNRVKMINRRSNFNQFAFHLSNPAMTFFRNILMKYLVKNENFLENYLGKIYKN
tara:strand:+ start:809 stop:1954 length:1146 start_codon:yes stop_codon:yes gene_type:complete